MSSITSEITDPMPIACALTGAEYRRRIAKSGEITRAALRERRRIAGGLRLSFAGSGDVHERLERFVAAESRCCPFLTMRLAAAGHEIVLEVTGPAGAAPIIEELFA